MEKPRVIEYSAHESITLLLYSKGPKFRTRYSNPTAGGERVLANATYTLRRSSRYWSGVYILHSHVGAAHNIRAQRTWDVRYTPRGDERRNLPDTTTTAAVRNNNNIIIYIIQGPSNNARASFLFRRPRRIYNIIYCARGPRDSGALPSFRGCAFFFFLSPGEFAENAPGTYNFHVYVRDDSLRIIYRTARAWLELVSRGNGQLN